MTKQQLIAEAKKEYFEQFVKDSRPYGPDDMQLFIEKVVSKAIDATADALRVEKGKAHFKAGEPIKFTFDKAVAEQGRKVKQFLGEDGKAA